MRRAYAPSVEALEALRLLSQATAPLLPPFPVEHGPLPDSSHLTPTTQNSAAWDAALAQSNAADLLGSTATPADRAAAQSGLDQFDRYLSRAWFRAGIPVQQHDDSTQAVYVTMLQNLGRDRFDAMLVDVGRSGIREVLSRETPEGPDFFRAIDTVKKRVQREKTFQALDETIATAGGDGASDRTGALHEAIGRMLSPREAALVRETLMGKTPAEIAMQWGVAPKTVSNEKTRVIQKLRDALAD
jgi:DNA-binding CsgD family transcriptional regulator